MTTPLGITPGNWWESSNNGFMDAGMGQTLANGDLEKWADPAAGVVVDSMYYAGYGWFYTSVYPMTIYPVTVPDTATITPIDTTEIPVDATIAFSDILYWVGEGANEAVMAVNWADTALAWGYRWNGTATVADMMADIAAADPRFSYTGEGLISDINYIDTAAGMTTPLGITPGNWWESKNNGVMDMGTAQVLSNGDFEKWADPAAGVVVDSVYYDGWGWSYLHVYPMTITPVTVPDTTTTPIDSTGISEISMAVESIWPNPTTSIVNVSVNRDAKAALYDLSGRCVEVYALEEGRNTLDLAKLPAGVYMLRVENSVSKIVKR
jgi:hypothetical protein